ncbi:MAG: hypothetical protein V4813_17945 [Gemmatimonadota bacterium]
MSSRGNARQVARAWLLLLAVVTTAQAQRSVPEPAPARVGLRYTLRHDASQPGMVEVEVRLVAPRRAPVDFAMPRAIPMGYGTQPYDRFVEGLVARDTAGRVIAVTDIDGPRWRIAASAAQPLQTIAYRVNVQRMEMAILNAGDASRMRPGYAGLLGYSVFGFVDGTTESAIALDIRMPPDWPIFSTLATSPSRGTLSVRAENFLALADAQVMAGPALQLRQRAARVPFTLAVYSEQTSLDADSLAALASEALDRAVAYFGSTTLPRYTAAYEVLTPISADHVYRFSMEHLESATYRLAVGQLDLAGEGRDRTFYNLLHHTVHSWLPKQCAPAGYYPAIWDHAAPIDGIWFSEGWAQYLAADIFAGSGADAVQRRAARVALRFAAAAVDSSPPLEGQGTEALSRIASHQYSEDFRISATVFSRGALMAQAIDERIRRQTHGRQSIRDVAQALMAWCSTSSSPVTADVIVDVVQRSTGVASRDVVQEWLRPRGPTTPDRPRP